MRARRRARTVRDGDPPLVLGDVAVLPRRSWSFGVWRWSGGGRSRRSVPGPVGGSGFGDGGGGDAVGVVGDEALEGLGRRRRPARGVVLLGDPRQLRLRGSVEEIHRRRGSEQQDGMPRTRRFLVDSAEQAPRPPAGAAVRLSRSTGGGSKGSGRDPGCCLLPASEWATAGGGGGVADLNRRRR